MFWRFGGYASISPVDTLLNKPDVTLEELLEESELIQELKQHNTKLIEYLREDNVLKRLMDYVIAPSLIDDEEEPEDERRALISGEKDARSMNQKQAKGKQEMVELEDLGKAEKLRLKYAYIACEILSSETWSILESMMLSETYLRDFWEFMKRPAPLDSLQAGYFTKVNETLFDRKTEEMLAFFKSLPGIVPAMLQHVDNPMVMDLLLKIISLERAEGGLGIADWLKTQGLVPVLLSYLSSDHPAAVQTSAGDFLKAIITISANATQNEQSCIGPNSLTRQLVSAPCAGKLISSMLQGGNSLTVGVGIVIEVIRKNNSDYDPENAGGPDSSPTMYDPIYLGTLLRLFAKHIPDFMALILSSKHAVNEDGQSKLADRGQLSCAWGTKIEPLGFDRFKTCELMAELLHCSNMALLNESGSEEYIRQRNEERERLKFQEAFEFSKEEGSGINYSDNPVNFTNGSILDSGSPEELRVLDATNVSEEDGFEDVDASTVLVDGVRDVSEKEEPEKEAKNDSFCAPLRTSKFEMNEDLVDEPLVSPKIVLLKSGDQFLPQPQAQSQSQSQGLGPASPTACGLTDGVGDIKIEGEEQLREETSSSPLRSRAGIELDTGLQHSENLTENKTASGHHAAEPPVSLIVTSQPQIVHSNPQPLIVSDSGTSLGPELNADGVQDPAPVAMGNTHDRCSLQVQYDPNGQPVVGDYLKMMFVENQVVPTILGFFFRFPWNNFLHNVVYDVVQQVFNGPMDRGFNRSLATDLFETGRITEQIVDGQRRSDEVQAATHVRLGYMGHLTLIAEEVVKFTERHPPEVLSQAVMEKVLHSDWIDYVERTLSETRERDNAILGGVRPDVSAGHRQAVLNAVGVTQGFTGSSALANAGLNGGGSGSAFDGFDIMTQGSASSGAFGLAGGTSSLLSSFGSSSDDEDEEMEDQDDEDGKNAMERSSGGGSENSSGSVTQPIPIFSAPPAPLNIAPSRARRQLAARLALHRQQAAEAAARTSQITSDSERDIKNSNNISKSNGDDEPWQSNPFIISGLEDDSTSVPTFHFDDTEAVNRDDALSSPTFPRTGFTPPGSPSTASSDDVDEGTPEAVRRTVRIPLEVDDDDDDDDDDDMGEMVTPTAGPDMMDSDDEDEAIINESMGYETFYEPSRYGGLGRSHIKDGHGRSHFDEDIDAQNDSSDGEEDDGLVEILFPGRKTSGSG